MARFVRANGLTFAVTQAGPADGPLALLLHGFPDTFATWRHLMPRLAAAGYRVAAPAMRGYAPTGVPTERSLDPDTLPADANALHRALRGRSDAVVIGHDWGAVAATRAAAAAPDRWRRVVTMAVPPERVLARAATDLRQLRRSAYTLRAQLPGMERRLADPQQRLVRRLWQAWSPGYPLGEEDLGPLRACFTSPGVPRAVLSYYRGFAVAVVRDTALSQRCPLPPQPHLVLHGQADGCIDAGYAHATAGHLPHPTSRVVVLDELGHFLHLEAPDAVGDEVLAFLTDDVRAPRGGAAAR